MKNIAKILDKIRQKQPLVFHITNLVTINDCANITLSVGASPLMSFCEDELEDILSFSSSLVINIGTMENQMQQIALKAGKIANKLNIPIILDPVGVGASSARKNLVSNLLQEIEFAVIKGNQAEIKSLLGLRLQNQGGVDSRESFDDGQSLKDLAKKLNSIIAMSGKVDMVSDGQRVTEVHNGIEILSKISGTGCMCASLIASACGAGEDFFESSVFGLSLMGVSAEIAKENGASGNGSLKLGILDSIYNINEQSFNDKIKLR